MDWAKDQLGKPIHASQRAPLSYRYYCGKCGEPVFRRAGAQRTAHFAHYSHSPKPECEFYHPSSDVTLPQSTRARIAQRIKSNNPSLLGGIVLSRREGGGYSLNLKLPRLPAETALIGEIEIRSGLGIRTYSANQLQWSQFVPVVPQLPLVKIYASESLAHAAAVINVDISQFRSTDNYFRVSEAGSKLLGSEEPLEWGERYWVITQRALTLPSEGLGIEIESENDGRGWNYHEIVLPTSAQAMELSSEEAIGQYLRRSVRPSRARVYFVEPAPHHIEPDGTYIFQETTEKIILRRTPGSRLDVEVGSQTVSEPTVNELQEEWCEISGVVVGDFTVLVEGREELFGRIEKCQLFTPAGIRVKRDDLEGEIFQLHIVDIVRHNLSGGICVVCPSTLVANYLALDTERWSRDGLTYRLRDASYKPTIDAGNFGVLASPRVEGLSLQPKLTDPTILAKRVWIEGLVARFGGVEALVHLRRGWNEANSTLVMNEMVNQLVWMRPYLRTMR